MVASVQAHPRNAHPGRLPDLLREAVSASHCAASRLPLEIRAVCRWGHMTSVLPVSPAVDDARAQPATSLPPAALECLDGDLRRLGEALNERTADVVAGMLQRTKESGQVLDETVEESFERVGAVSTVAVARWMAGEGVEVAKSLGRSLDSSRLSAPRR
jgi:hypothetical protein